MQEKKNQTERALTVLEALFFEPINGLANIEICQKTGFHAVDVSRLLKTLHEARWAEKNKYGRWVPSVRFLGFIKKYNLALGSVTGDIEEIEQRSNAYARR